MRAKRINKIEMIFCACDCGTEFNKYDWRNRVRKFYNSHGRFQKGILGGAPFKKGHRTWNKGKRGVHNNTGRTHFKEGHVPWCAGKKLSKEHKKHIGEAGLGRYCSDETRIKISLKMRGDKNGRWRGGISYEPYSADWTNTLKRSIRERDKYTCLICKKEPAVVVHHIDYNKKNCDPDNLITLCRKCHPKTNSNREQWISYFSLKLNLSKGGCENF